LQNGLDLKMCKFKSSYGDSGRAQVLENQCWLEASNSYHHKKIITWVCIKLHGGVRYSFSHYWTLNWVGHHSTTCSLTKVSYEHWLCNNNQERFK